jgi:hypothetical protein
MNDEYIRKIDESVRRADLDRREEAERRSEVESLRARLEAAETELRGALEALERDASRTIAKPDNPAAPHGAEPAWHDRAWWEARLERDMTELEEALSAARPDGVVLCLAHTLSTHPPLEVDDETMGRVVLLLSVAYSQGAEIERQRHPPHPRALPMPRPPRTPRATRGRARPESTQPTATACGTEWSTSASRGCCGAARS